MRLLTVMFILLASAASAGEGEGRVSLCANIPLGPRSDRCHEWVQTLPRPDTGGSCCGPADAYIADDFVRRDGKLFFIITEDYPMTTVSDEEGNVVPCTQCFQVKKGMEIEVPPEKLIVNPEWANRSPHGYVFIGSGGVLYCAGFGPLI